MNSTLKDILARHTKTFYKVVHIKSDDKIISFDFTVNNKEISPSLIADTNQFSAWVNKKLEDAGATFAIGGYSENRVLYKRSNLFEGEQERSLHLGVDIWGAAGTPVFAPMGGMIHSYAFNDNFGDYGATIILQHHLGLVTFYTLYGHLSVEDLKPLRIGKYIAGGELFAHFGEPSDNGNWPPHLHFQIIEDMDIKLGDYPGVCCIKESEKYLKNCPDANLMLNF